MVSDVPGSRRGKGKRLVSGDMEWDDSGMNIIVNPIESGKEAEEGKAGLGDAEFSDEDSSDDDADFHDDDGLSMDGSEDDEDMGEVPLPSSPLPSPTLTHSPTSLQVLPHKGRKGLEWDDSTLHPTGGRPPKSNSYRV